VTNAYDPEHDNQIAYLLKLTGRRRSPAEEHMRRAREAARVEWRRAVQARGRRRLMMVAVAAIAAGVLGSAMWLWQSRSSREIDQREIATLQRAVGSIRITDGAGRQVSASVDGRPRLLRSGDRVDVAEAGRAAFELAGGASVRLAGGALVTFHSNSRLELERGKIYIDSNPARRAGPVVVDTPFGRVSHAGTQFELRLQAGSLTVRVREGQVAVDGRGLRETTAAGEALVIGRDRPAARSQIAISGPEWDWVAAIAEPFTLEGATVSAFLQWVSREQGWRWEYADAATKRLAERAVLHGSIEGLTPEEALAAVLPASGLASRRDGDRLIVSVAASIRKRS
jgi:ferric-dicitrate binding protein FerR (iron transport regulator)